MTATTKSNRKRIKRAWRDAATRVSLKQWARSHTESPWRGLCADWFARKRK